MKSRLPANWTIQLVGIILLFSVGLALFPSAYLLEDLRIRSYRPPTVYHGMLQGNLTESNPVVSDSLGVCSDIYIFACSVDPTAVFLLHFKDSQNETVLILPMSNTYNTSGYNIIQLFMEASNYSVEAHRFLNDTFFQCSIRARIVYPMTSVAHIIIDILWPIGFILIVAGIVSTWHFIRRTKEFISEKTTI